MHAVNGKREALTPTVVSFVTGVTMLAGAIGTLILTGSTAPDPTAILLWTAVFLAGEILILHTPTGKGTVSMASAMHLSLLLITSLPILLPAVWISRLTANLIFQRQAWYKALFNAAQVSLALAGAFYTYKFFDGARPILSNGSTLTQALPAFAAAATTYYVINTGLVSAVLALVTRTPLWLAWRENYGYRVALVSFTALFLLAPVATIAYQAAGIVGLILFFLPMLFIRDAFQRYIILERAQRALIGSERLAAKGEMAASVGHEINNYLSVISGTLQLIQRKGEKVSAEDGQTRLQQISEQVTQMASLSKGLMDFSSLDSKPVSTDLCSLIRETVDFLKPQDRYDATEISVDYDNRVGILKVDPAQIQQVLMNLLNNAADTLGDAGVARKRISVWVRWIGSKDVVEIGVQDNGPGIPDDIKRRIFEPGFTTKDSGHGFGLSTVYRIVDNHEGRISVEDAAEGGTVFRVRLPAQSTQRRPLSAA